MTARRDHAFRVSRKSVARQRHLHQRNVPGRARRDRNLVKTDRRRAITNRRPPHRRNKSARRARNRRRVVKNGSLSSSQAKNGGSVTIRQDRKSTVAQNRRRRLEAVQVTLSSLVASLRSYSSAPLKKNTAEEEWRDT